jgi:hypothetical protein
MFERSPLRRLAMVLVVVGVVVPVGDDFVCSVSP